MDDNTTEVKKPVRVLYIYSDVKRDEELQQTLEKHLSILTRKALIDGWSKDQVLAGQIPAQEIDSRLAQAEIILLLVSSDFIASKECYRLMELAMQRHADKKSVVIPVLLRPLKWQATPFGHLQPLPKNGKPISEWSNRDSAFSDVAQELQKVVEAISQRHITSFWLSPPNTTSIPLQRGELISTFSLHAGNVVYVAWSPDGTRLASTATDGTMRIWTVAGDHLVTHHLPQGVFSKASI